MKKSSPIPLLCLVLLTLTSACSRHPDDELSETLAWMDNTYNPHEGVSLAVGHGRNAPVNRASGWATETFKYDGCQMTLRVEDTFSSVAHNDGHSTTSYIFNLRDINPQSIKISTVMGGFRCEPSSSVNCDHAEITFLTRTEAPLVEEESYATLKLQVNDHLSNSKSKGTGAFFEVDDVEYATRLARAFQHAVELCGGKAPPF